MNKKLLTYCIIGFVFVSIIGTLFHFVYEWSGNNFIVGLFTPINESVWEHIKLLFFPMLIYSLYMNKQLKTEYPCVNSGLSLGILIGSFLIPIIFYTYTGILGFDISAIDIAIFFICVIVAFFVAYKFTLSCSVQKYTKLLNITLFIMILLFLLFTYSPPNIGLFVSP